MHRIAGNPSRSPVHVNEAIIAELVKWVLSNSVDYHLMLGSVIR